jgi:hypothetical protein
MRAGEGEKVMFAPSVEVFLCGDGDFALPRYIFCKGECVAVCWEVLSKIIEEGVEFVAFWQNGF